MPEADTAPFNDLARGKNCFYSQYVIGGHSILEAVRAAGIESYVSSDSANGLTGWIRRVMKSVHRGSICDLTIDYPWLNDGNALLWIKADDPVEAIQSDHDPVSDWKRTAGKTCPAAPRDKWNALLPAKVYDRNDFLRRVGNHHSAGSLTKCGQAITFISRKLFRPTEQALRWEQRIEAFERGNRHYRASLLEVP